MERFLLTTTELREYHALRIAMLFGPLEISCKVCGGKHNISLSLGSSDPEYQFYLMCVNKYVHHIVNKSFNQIEKLRNQILLRYDLLDVCSALTFGKESFKKLVTLENFDLLDVRYKEIIEKHQRIRLYISGKPGGKEREYLLVPRQV